MFEYVLVYGDDWCGLYLNGMLMYQDHSIEPSKIFEIILNNGNSVTSYCEVFCDAEWLCDRGKLPWELKNVVES